MKYKFINLAIIGSIILSNAILLPINADNTISYPTYKDTPGYNTPVKDHKFDNVTPILFTPFEDVVTGDDSNKNQVGYFWPIKDPDRTLHFPGKARIGNSQYINVIAVDSKKVSKIGDADTIVDINKENIYNPTPEEKQEIEQDLTFLIPIGTFMKLNDPTIYTVMGQYVSTAFPDPREIASAGPNTINHVVEE